MKPLRASGVRWACVAGSSLPLLTGGCPGGGGCRYSKMTVTVAESELPDGGATTCQEACAGRGPEGYDLISCGPSIADGGVAIQCVFEGISSCGRYPIKPVPVASGSSTGSRWLGRAAYVEAASAWSFSRLAVSLSHHRAPPKLIQEAQRAARDERRHARLTGEAAHRFGGTPPPFAASSPRCLELDMLALENAVDGCLVETWGAHQCAWQAQASREPNLRRMFASIAEDERRHAAFAQDLQSWLDGRLTSKSKRLVRELQHEAFVALRSGLDVPQPKSLLPLGLPDRKEAKALFGQVFGQSHRSFFS